MSEGAYYPASFFIENVLFSLCYFPVVNSKFFGFKVMLKPVRSDRRRPILLVSIYSHLPVDNIKPLFLYMVSCMK